MPKQILVTGASRGIGFHLSRKLVYQGHTVMALSRSEEGLARLSEDCAGLAGHCHTIVGNIQEAETVRRALREKLDYLDVLINNAAYFMKRPLAMARREDLEQVYNTNVIGPLLLIQSLVPMMRPGAHIVNISSVGGLGGSLKFPELYAYSSSKGALNILTECLAVDLEKEKIHVNALALGSSETEMFKAAFPDFQAATKPAEMAEYIAHFALEQGHLFNGKVIPVSAMTP